MLPLRRAIGKPSAIKGQDSPLVKYLIQNRFKVTKTSQRQLPLYTGSFYQPAFSSTLQTCHGGKQYTDVPEMVPLQDSVGTWSLGAGCMTHYT